MRLFWHRRDLRVRDNRGLATAAADGPVVSVFVRDTDLLDRLGDRQRAFFLRGVRRLRESYRDLGSDLIVREGRPSDVLPELAEEFGAEAVVYNEHYRPERRDRQNEVDAACADAGLATAGETDLVLVDPARLDERYPNHGRFRDAWQAVPKEPLAPAPDAEDLASPDGVDPGTVPEEPTADIELPAAGYRAARERYDDFLANGIDSYRASRDDLARAVEAPTLAVSRMSPYLAAGMIGVREVWADASERREAATGEECDQVWKYLDELTWREQQYHLLYCDPDLPTKNYKSIPNEIEWRDDADEFDAWKRGETGYPLVDAGMRQLREEGYVHNRPRQVVASFLTKHLLVDWRKGRRHFAEQLVDHDPASNAGNWQWIASTGIDSVDVRIFDPVAQASKYDDEARFVKAYVPELRDVPAGEVVDWPTLPPDERERLAPEYPDPIVDRDAAYERAQRVFERALGKR
ncbi:cryptochrome/photolyase family protein [Halosimplex pelagicum]|uniref:Deoxyribodipyrimidine photo-lyase n=1 Tax=Halosimplex pelagicum TaxID=869886 RepID=A0A7D5PBR4_9EURY|nr:deoxyribodipyrimidine photo-lyase [Halosimplex pelagicum]QLH83984.1 deoxyribodipyrimidine photo-lyase [Halosimplex pelagicum]